MNVWYRTSLIITVFMLGVTSIMAQTSELPLRDERQKLNKYDNKPWIAEVAYLQKDWRTADDETSITEDRWYADGKALHGAAVRVGYRPAWPVLGPLAAGVATGLGCELYCSENHNPPAMFNGRNRFMEVDLSVPVHAQLLLPYKHNMALSVEGGIGMDMSVYGAYDYKHGGGETMTDVYGHGFPRRFNLSWEVGASVRVGVFNVKFLWSGGITDHRIYKYIATRQNKWSLSLGYVF